VANLKAFLTTHSVPFRSSANKQELAAAVREAITDQQNERDDDDDAGTESA